MIVLTPRDGPQIGQTIEIRPPRRRLGGRGSQADTVLSGVPPGLDLAVLEMRDGAWLLMETEPRTLLLNGRRLKRHNALKTGDEIALPSQFPGDVIRYDVEVRAVRGRATELPDLPDRTAAPREKKGLSPVAIGAIAAYLIALAGAGLYFSLQSDGGAQTPVLSRSDIEAAIAADMEMLLAGGRGGGAPRVALETPSSFAEMRDYLASTVDQSSKDAAIATFTDDLGAAFFEAWRLEQQGRWDEALRVYQGVLSRTSDRELATTRITLERIDIARDNSRF